MKNLIERLITFFRFVFRGKLPKPNKPVPNPDWQPGIIVDNEIKVGQLNTYAAGTQQVLAPSPKPTDLPSRIVDYMYEKVYYVNRNPNEGNIIYISGMRDLFAFWQENKIDEWDDLRMIVKFGEDGVPCIDFWQAASTEPGTISRKSAAAKKLGGVATVVPGQYKAWKIGYHKHNVDHPALVQCANIVIWRDSNTNESFDGGDMMFEGVYGINQHSRRPGFSGPRVGAWSAGCLVGKDFGQHLDFINRLKQWDCYKENQDCVFWTTVIPGKSLWKEESPLSV